MIRYNTPNGLNTTAGMEERVPDYEERFSEEERAVMEGYDKLEEIIPVLFPEWTYLVAMDNNNGHFMLASKGITDWDILKLVAHISTTYEGISESDFIKAIKQGKETLKLMPKAL